MKVKDLMRQLTKLDPNCEIFMEMDYNPADRTKQMYARLLGAKAIKKNLILIPSWQQER